MRIFFKLFLLILCLSLSGCGNISHRDKDSFVYGTAAYNAASSNAGVNPCIGYQGWSALRYGVGETLFRLNGSMRPEPWLAEGYSFPDSRTITIRLRRGISFSSGRRLTGKAAADSLAKLTAENRRAASLLKITSLSCTENTVTITSAAAAVSLPAALCDPAACIMDYSSGQPAGTGPYIPLEINDSGLCLQRREDYWSGQPSVRTVTVRSITDSGTLAMALQSGELDAASGLSAAGLEYFSGRPEFRISSAATARICQAAFNLDNPVLRDVRVRKAISAAVNRREYTKVLLKGSSTPAVSPFSSCGSAEQDDFNPEKARRLLREAGWTDSDGDGYADRGGKPLTLRWLTYSFRPELPLLAESAQNYLKQIGIKLEIKVTDSFADYLRRSQWDIYAQTLIAAPVGEPEGYFTSYIASGAANNYGGYSSPEADALISRLQSENDNAARDGIVHSLCRILAEDCPYFYICRMNASVIMRAGTAGLAAHPSDYYEITSLLTKQ